MKEILNEATPFFILRTHPGHGVTDSMDLRDYDLGGLWAELDVNKLRRIKVYPHLSGPCPRRGRIVLRQWLKKVAG